MNGRWPCCLKSRRWSGLLLALFSLGGPSLAVGDPPSSPGEMLEVAELRDVFFLDPERGWAVGDRGVIWQTQDGGRSWQLADSPATCRLESISFCDANHGWIVGGWLHPVTQKSSAIVLRTENGGRRWTRVEVPALPALKWVKFSDPRNGWAIGNSSVTYPAGAFSSDDGGFAWHALPLADRISAKAATWNGPRLLVVDRDDLLWTLAGSRRDPGLHPATEGRRIHALAVEGTDAWAVGDGGLVLWSRDGGRRWESPRRAAPDEIRREFDWQTVAVRGPRCWIAGSPGTNVLHSSDAGVTWQIQRTGQSLPIRRLFFVDENHGWAVGEFGMILATLDGGRSWRVQRRGGQRAALLGLFATPQQVPWELYASVAADEGYCTVASLLTRPLPDGSSEATSEDCFREAVSSVGSSSATAAWSFPLPAAGPVPSVAQLLSRWDQGRPGSAMDRLEEHVVRQIRLWRPDIVVTDVLSPDGSQPLSHLASQLVLRAAQRAGDAEVFPQQLVAGRLEPWPVKKVFALMPAGPRAATMVDPNRLAIHLGCSLGHYAAVSRALVAPHAASAERGMDLRLIHSEIFHDAAGRELFSGIVSGPVGEARRAPVRYGSVNLDSLSLLLQKQRGVEELVLREGGDDPSSEPLLAEVDRLLQGLSPHYAGVFLYSLAERLAEQGKIRCAADVYGLLVERQPRHMFAAASLLWLFRYHASAEWQHAFPAGPITTRIPSTIALASAEEPLQPIPARPPAARRAGADPDTGGTSPAVPSRVVNAIARIEPGARHASVGLGQAVQLAAVMRQNHLPLFQESCVQLPLMSVYRRLGDDAEADRVARALNHASLPPGWQAVLLGELGLTSGASRSPPTLDCPPTNARPFLDGKLDDTLWQHAGRVELMAARAEHSPSTTFLCSSDDDFLYFAVRCARAPGCLYTRPAGTRPRDADLSGQDHVELLLDVDRDYQSCYRLAVDQRGWARESCGESRAWNPRWHVAVGGDAEHWVVEAAVPWRELIADRPGAQDVWAIKIQRILPIGITQAWPIENPQPPSPPLLQATSAASSGTATTAAQAPALSYRWALPADLRQSGYLIFP